MTPIAAASAALTLIAALTASGSARAGIDLVAVDACVAASVTAGTPATDCVDEAQAACLDSSQDTPSVAALCFVEAKDGWSAAIASAIDEVRATAPDELAAVIAIEAKYDLLSALLQCDRMEDLALAVGSRGGEEIRLQKTRCAATAAGLAYIRLKARRETLE